MNAQFYSILAIILLVPIIFLIYIYVDIHSKQSGIYENIVADQMYQVKENIENDFIKAIVTSGKRALIAASDYVIMNGEPLDNASHIIKEMIENGDVNGEEVILMINNTLPYWKDKIIKVPTNFIVDINFSNLEVSDFDAFNIKIKLKLNISLSDKLNIARIDRKNLDYEVLILIKDIEDPLYTLKTNGVLTKTIKPSPFPYRAKKLVKGGLNSSGSCYGEVTFNKNDCTDKILVTENLSGVNLGCFSGFVIEESVNLTNVDCYISGNESALEIIKNAIETTNYEKIYIDGETTSVWHLPIREEIDEGYYFSGNGPTILKRLENNLNETQNGLESFVNLPELQSYNIPIKTDVVCVDYIYFGEQNYIGYPVRGLQTWFRINRNFAEKYGLIELCDGC